MRWLTTTNHKDIGTLYLFFALIMLFAAGSMALLIRAELFQPGLQMMHPDFFNQLTTMHGLIMIFGVIMPAFSGFANWQVPLMLGAPDMAFPRMNNWAFWVLPVAGLMLMSSFLLPGGAVAGGWTMYPPLFIQGGISYDLTILAVHSGHVLDPGFDQHHHHDPEHARPGHDADEDAAVLLDLADYRLPADRGDAGAGRGGDHAAHRPPFRHHVLQCGRWR
jgi:hypothetical protein